MIDSKWSGYYDEIYALLRLHKWTIEQDDEIRKRLGLPTQAEERAKRKR